MELKLATPKGYSVAKDLRTTAAQLKEQAEAIQDFVGGKLDQISNEIIEKSEELEALKIKLDEKRRVETLDLELMIKKDKTEAFQKLAAELNHAIIKQDDYTKLRSELTIAQGDIAERIEKEVSAAQSKVYAEKNGEISRLKSAHEVATAQLEADNKMLQQKVAFLNDQLDKAQLSLERAQEANVKIAEAQKSTVVNTGK